MKGFRLVVEPGGTLLIVTFLPEKGVVQSVLYNPHVTSPQSDSSINLKKEVIIVSIFEMDPGWMGATTPYSCVVTF